MDTFDRGDLVRVAATFRNSAGTLIDPTVVKFSFKTPAEVTTTYTYPTDVALVKDSAGNYHVDVNADADGPWFTRFFSTGAGQAAAEGQFFIKSNF